MIDSSRRDSANFDPVARLYRWVEYLTFGRALERCRNHFLAQLSMCENALVFGDGDGRFLAGLLAVNKRLEADAVDSSAAMLLLLNRRAEQSIPDSRVRLRIHLSGAMDYEPHRIYDLVVTHFFLDCLTQTEVERLCKQTLPHLKQEALWLVSDFCIPDGAMYWPAKTVVDLLYRAFRVLTGLRVTELPNHATALAAAGFLMTAQHNSLAGLLTTQLWQRREYTAVMLPAQRPKSRNVSDPVPNPEPASPSLPGPDLGVFHHAPGTETPGDPDRPFDTDD